MLQPLYFPFPQYEEIVTVNVALTYSYAKNKNRISFSARAFQETSLRFSLSNSADAAADDIILINPNCVCGIQEMWTARIASCVILLLVTEVINWILTYRKRFSGFLINSVP